MPLCLVFGVSSWLTNHDIYKVGILAGSMSLNVRLSLGKVAQCWKNDLMSITDELARKAA